MRYITYIEDTFTCQDVIFFLQMPQAKSMINWFHFSKAEAHEAQADKGEADKAEADPYPAQLLILQGQHSRTLSE